MIRVTKVCGRLMLVVGVVFMGLAERFLKCLSVADKDTLEGMIDKLWVGGGIGKNEIRQNRKNRTA